jgi:YhcH/YjgK/YiaL family protein
MILDHLAHADRYRAMGDRIAAALDFLRRPETAVLEPKALGSEHSLRVEIDGDDVFALIQKYTTKSPCEAFWEAHCKHIDVQCVIEGAELMGHAPIEHMKVVQPYDDAKDYAKFQPMIDGAQTNHIRFDAGMFAIFMPHDVHMPGLAVDGLPAMVKKIVVKVRV